VTEDDWNRGLATERLLLTPLIPIDADELVELLNDRRLYQFTGGYPPQLDELRSRFEGWAGRLSPDGRERWLNWVIRERPTKRAVGTLQATIRTGDIAPVAEVAWVLGVHAQGHGYASEGARALVAHLLARGVGDIIAHIHPDHDASARVAAAIGMQPTEEWSEGERLWRLSNAGSDLYT
jgi:RimJ/RimL family protein N-acetyltransferase